MSKRIYVTVEGGVVQDISSNFKDDEIEVVVVDHDIEGLDEENLDCVVYEDDTEDEVSIGLHALDGNTEIKAIELALRY